MLLPQALRPVNQITQPLWPLSFSRSSRQTLCSCQVTLVSLAMGRVSSLLSEIDCRISLEYEATILTAQAPTARGRDRAWNSEVANRTEEQLRVDQPVRVPSSQFRFPPTQSPPARTDSRP